MRPRVYWPVTFAATALVALLSYGVVSTGPDTSIDESISNGDRVEAPTSELRELGGDGTGSLADHQGKVVVLNLWASWCPPCRSEMPLLERTHKRIAAQDGLVLGIDSQDASEDAMRFLREKKITFPSLRDRDGEYARRARRRGPAGDVPDRPPGPDRRACGAGPSTRRGSTST